MKTSRLLAIFFIVSCFNAGAGYAANHHSGHGGGSSGGRGSESTCLKPQLTKFIPTHLATVAPGSAFSFWALNVSNPKQIEVVVKTIPIALTTEIKDGFYLVKGNLPAELVNTVARINIKVNSKITKCDAENGWLVKISE